MSLLEKEFAKTKIISRQQKIAKVLGTIFNCPNPTLSVYASARPTDGGISRAGGWRKSRRLCIRNYLASNTLWNQRAHSPRRLHTVLGNSGENRMKIWTHVPLKPNLRIMSNLHFAIFDSVLNLLSIASNRDMYLFSHP